MAAKIPGLGPLSGFAKTAFKLFLGMDPDTTATSPNHDPSSSQQNEPGHDSPRKNAGKRKREYRDYEDGSDYYHLIFDSDWATDRGLEDEAEILQQRMAQDEKRNEWQSYHNRIFGTDKKVNDGNTPQVEVKLSKTDKLFIPVIEMLIRTDPIKRKFAMVPAAGHRDTENGEEDTTDGTTNPKKAVNVAPGVKIPEDDIGSDEAEGTVAVANASQSTGTVSTHLGRARRRRIEGFRAHPILPRTDQHFETAISILKGMMAEWTRLWFFGQASEEERQNFNLHAMFVKSPHLMEYVGYIAAGGDDEQWKNYFLHWRSSTAFGVIGKMLEVHVFGHTMFGATPSQMETLDAMDMQLLKVDGNNTKPFLISYNVKGRANNRQDLNVPKSAPK